MRDRKKFFLKYVFVTLVVYFPPGVIAENTSQLDVFQQPIQLPKTTFSDGVNRIGLDSFYGKYVLLNFWATWCAPCVREMPALDGLAGMLAKKNLIVIAVSQDESGPPVVQPFIKKLNLLNTQILYDESGRGFRDFALRGLPTTILISPDGLILARLEGSAEWQNIALVDQLETLIKNYAPNI